MRTFAVINQKGGCGKTTTAINLAAAFASLGRRTLLVDMDPQSHCALGLAIPENQLEASIADALLADRPDGFDLNEIVWQINTRLDLAPSSVALAAAEQSLTQFPDKDQRLSVILGAVRERYDLGVIDCPPNIGLLTFNALRAATDVIIPVETGFFALQGSVRQTTTLEVLAEKCGHEVRLHVLPTMYDVRTKMAREILTELKRQFGDRVVEAPIHFNAKLKEAASFGQPITEYDPASRGCEDFAQLAMHLLATNGQAKRPRPATAEHDGGDAPASAPVAAPVVMRRAVIQATVAAHATPSAAAPRPVEPAATSLTHRGDRPARTRAAIAVASTAQRSDADAHALMLAEPLPDVPVSRAAELAQRAKALTERTVSMQQRLAADPDIARIDAELLAAEQPRRDPQAQRTLEEKLKSLYGVKVTQQGTLFVQPDRNVRSVCVAGDFNEWSPVATPMHRNDRLGVWQTCLPLPPGRYRYRLVVDGAWLADPHNSRVETNPYGELNNVVDVT